MAVSNGSWQNYARIEWDYSLPSVGQDTTSFQPSVYAYLRMDGNHSTNGTWLQSWSGRWGSGSENQSIVLSANQRKLIVYGGGSAVTLGDSPQTISFVATGRHYYGATGATLSITVPARYARTPTAFTVTRVSDVQQTLAWTRNSTYTSVVVQRRTDGGVWQEIARPTGNVATFTDTTTVAGHRYDYRVAGIGGSGQSRWSDEATVYTAPAAPTGVAASRVGATNILVEVASVPAYATSFDIRDGDTVVASGVSLPWTHVSPNPAVPHTYRVRGVVDGIAGEWSAPSNTVQLIAKPNPPANLSPNGGVAASDTDVVFSWTHNPVDSSAQTAYELRHRPVSGSWTTLSGTTASTRQVPLTVGDYEWQARTKGAHADWSDWSAVATVTVITRPGVAVVVPEDTYDLPTLPVEWSWLQAQGRQQSSWKVTLLGDVGQQLEVRTGTGPTTTVTLNTRLIDGGQYTVRVEAATGAVWSDPAVQVFDVLFVPPAPPQVEVSWSETAGTATITTDAGSGEDAPETERIDIDRSIDGGETWERILTGVAPAQTLVDPECLSYGDTLYRVTGWAVTGAAAETIATCAARSGALWLAGGPGFTVCERLPFSPKVTVEAARARSMKRYAGRELPVGYSGFAVARTVQVSGLIADEATAGETTAGVAALDRLATVTEPIHLFRDPDGRRVYGVIGSIQMPRQENTPGEVRDWNAFWGYSFTLTDTGR